MKIKKFDDINEAIKPPIADKKEKKLTAEEFLFNRYLKYYHDAKSFKDIQDEQLSFRKIAQLMEEYKKL